MDLMFGELLRGLIFVILRKYCVRWASSLQAARRTHLLTKQRQSEQTSKKQRQDQLISELISPKGIVVYVQYIYPSSSLLFLFLPSPPLFFPPRVHVWVCPCVSLCVCVCKTSQRLVYIYIYVQYKR